MRFPAFFSFIVLSKNKKPKNLDFTGFSGISLLVNSRPKSDNFSWFFHLFEMEERFLGVFFQKFLKKFLKTKKPSFSLLSAKKTADRNIHNFDV